MSAPEASPRCPDCQAQLPPGQPRGICPTCALKAALNLPADQTAPADFDLPKTFGNYLLLEKVARGGTGIVYRARQTSLNRIVAVKMLLEGTEAREELLERLKTEAFAAGGLHHPNITAVHEIGCHEGRQFIAMDYVDGTTLAHHAARHSITPRQAAEYVRVVAEAIQHAHDNSILHRDLKPSNILIDSQNRVKVTDFGLARRIDGRSELTMTGQILGSPAYMPPEQAAGQHKQVGVRSDVYGLGAILYHLITGRPPFRGDTVTETLRQVIDLEPTAPHILHPGVPRDLETICMRCLEKIPGRRYATAQEVADELSRFLRDDPIRARPPGTAEKLLRWGRRNRLAAAFGAALTVALVSTVGLAVVLVRQKGETDDENRGLQALTDRQARMIEGNLSNIWSIKTVRKFTVTAEDVATLQQDTSVPPVKGTVLRWSMGIIANEAPSSQVRQHFFLLKNVQSQLNDRFGSPVRIDLVIYKFHEDLVEDLKTNRIQFGRLGAVRYLRSVRDRAGLQPLVVPSVATKFGVICTRTNTPILHWSDMAGRTLALGDTNATISFRALVLLIEHGVTSETLGGYEYFDRYLDFVDDIGDVGIAKALEKIGYLHSHAGAIEEVLAGRYDMAVTSQKAFYLQKDRGLQEVPGTRFESSRTLLVASPSFTPEHVAALRLALTSMKGWWMEQLPEQSVGFRVYETNDFAAESRAFEKVEQMFPPKPRAKN